MTAVINTSGHALGDLRDLPTTLPVWHASKVSAASLLGVGRSVAYEAAERGDLPSLRIGHRIVVPTAALLRMLGAQALADLDDAPATGSRS
ncbi:helix-turn-helix domain-containing protein [Nocardioides antri]|uniref:Helix-turn-helix domain-containing protein n=1 Tax=Nocardioides antri TaxID=2607659 RepID=A0A5B1M750_9ACTN|nr:helix-turn-helix domain-containing protein [Nocardioides antri]KAA1427869.1 helix-turn-helix domain-containing protein [Nocardioides antri]